MLDKIVTVLSKDYINPFGAEINQTKLVALSSGLPVLNDLADEILSIPESSLNLYWEFKNRRLSSCPEDDFSKTNNRNEAKLFNQSNKCILGSNKTKVVKTIEVNRNIIGRLIVIRIDNGKLLGSERAIKYSLAPSRLSICN